MSNSRNWWHTGFDRVEVALSNPIVELLRRVRFGYEKGIRKERVQFLVRTF